jgi:hypothetical protein
MPPTRSREKFYRAASKCLRPIIRQNTSAAGIVGLTVAGAVEVVLLVLHWVISGSVCGVNADENVSLWRGDSNRSKAPLSKAWEKNLTAWYFQCKQLAKLHVGFVGNWSVLSRLLLIVRR